MTRRRVASKLRREFWAAMREMQRQFEESRQRDERDREQRQREREQRQREREQEREQREQEWARSRERAERDMEDLRERQRQAAAQIRRSELLFTGHWGKLVESLVEGDLARLLQQRGVDVVAVTSRLELKLDPLRREIDLIALNHEDAVLVEVKTTLKVGDVRRYLELLDEVRPLLPTVFQRLRIYGGVAYLRAEEEAPRFAERRGLFVVRATGSSASIVNAPGFRPRVFDPELPAANT